MALIVLICVTVLLVELIAIALDDRRPSQPLDRIAELRCHKRAHAIEVRWRVRRAKAELDANLARVMEGQP